MQPINILFVDDDQVVRTLFCKIVGRLMSCRAKTAVNGLDALKQLKTFQAHIVITDIMMPEMDGITLLKQIKALYPRTFVILLTGHATVDNAVQAMKFGAYDYLQKPLAAKRSNWFCKKSWAIKPCWICGSNRAMKGAGHTAWKTSSAKTAPCMLSII